MPKLFEIKNKYLSVLINTLGCSIEKLTYKDLYNPLMQLKNSNRYANDLSLSGSIIGPYCGRLSKGQLNINNQKIQLSLNEGFNHLHGGYINCSNLNWDMCEYREDSITLFIILQDGLMGYPGKRKIIVKYSLSNSTLIIDIKAFTNKDTIFNITNHAYWNLSCNFNNKINDHFFKIPAKYYYLNNSLLVPTSIVSTKNTSFDFNQFSRLDRKLELKKPLDQVYDAKGYNHAFLCDNCEISYNDLLLSIKSSSSSMFLYSGGFLNSKTQLKNKGIASSNCAFAIEPQDINRQIVTTPSDTYKNTISYSFFT